MAGEGDDEVVGGLFGTYDLGGGNNRFVQAPTSSAAMSLISGFGGDTQVSAGDLGALLGGFRIRVTAGAGDDTVDGGILGSFDLGEGNNLFLQSMNTSELTALGQFLVDTVDVADPSVLGALFGGIGGTLTSSELGSVLGGFGASLGLGDLGTVLGGFGTGAVQPAQLGAYVGWLWRFVEQLPTEFPGATDRRLCAHRSADRNSVRCWAGSEQPVM